MQRHVGEGETIAEAIRDCLDYGKNPEKTESGKYISAYECDPATVADEFLLAKASYVAMTGREQKKANDVLCYQIRQSFYPGEITPKEANRIGYALAMRWTKGRHAFIVTTHTDKQHMLNICIVFAQLERETIQKRVTDAYYSDGTSSDGHIAYSSRDPLGSRSQASVAFIPLSLQIVTVVVSN